MSEKERNQNPGGEPEETRKRRRKRLYEHTVEEDMTYRGPINYQGFQMIGWACIVASVVVLIINIGGHVDAGVTAKYGKVAHILDYFAELSLPFLLMANFSKVLNNADGYKKQLLKNGGAALAIFFVTIVLGNRYLVGTVQQMVVQKDQVVDMITVLFRGFNQDGFMAFNLFVDLFLCTLTMYFLNARPKRFFTGKKLILLRLMSILPIGYELLCLWLKIQATRGVIMLDLWTFPLLTVKPPMTFAFFVYMAFLISARGHRFCKHGRTYEEYQEFMLTNRNSFHLSVHLCISMVVFAAIDLVMMLVITYLQAHTIVPAGADATVVNAALDEGVRVATSVGIGQSITLAVVAPLMLLYSYNAQPKRKIISTLIPCVAIVIIFLIFMEAIRMAVGMYMSGREIDLDVIKETLSSL